MAVLAAAAVAVAACQERTPTGVSAGFAASPTTIEVELPWSEFASNLEIIGGYGAAVDLGQGVIANEFGGTLNARTLVRFGGYPASATFRDADGTARLDSMITFPSGRVVVFLDTIASTATGPVELSLGALQRRWHPRTVSWTHAVDTIGDELMWNEAGAGPVIELSTATWDPTSGDSVLFALDSAELELWRDTTTQRRGARVDLITPGVRLSMIDAALRLDTRSSINPDTAAVLTAVRRDLTFIYNPFPEPPPDGVRIGGSPSWRTVLDMGVPAQLTGPPVLCAAVGCPHVIQAGEVSYAALVLTSRASEVAFQPSDSVSLDVRPVLSRAALPKAPLGESLIGTLFGRRVAADAFGASPGAVVEIPITPFLRSLIEGDDGSGFPPSNTLALLSVFEPLSISYASFVGPGNADEPTLRLVLTIGAALELP